MQQLDRLVMLLKATQTTKRKVRKGCRGRGMPLLHSQQRPNLAARRPPSPPPALPQDGVRQLELLLDSRPLLLQLDARTARLTPQDKFTGARPSHAPWAGAGRGW